MLRVITQQNDLDTLLETLRLEEWAPDNQNPFVVFDTVYTEDQPTFTAMTQAMTEHYRLLREPLLRSYLDLLSILILYLHETDESF